MPTSVLTLRLDSALGKRLSRLAKATDRTRSRLAADAIASYLDRESWQVEAIEEGVRAADAGEVVSQKAVEALVSDWGKPRTKRRR